MPYNERSNEEGNTGDPILFQVYTAATFVLYGSGTSGVFRVSYTYCTVICTRKYNKEKLDDNRPTVGMLNPKREDTQACITSNMYEKVQ